MSIPPEIRRRQCGGARTAPGAADVAERIRLKVLAAQPKLLASRRKLQAKVDALRAQLEARR